MVNLQINSIIHPMSYEVPQSPGDLFQLTAYTMHKANKKQMQCEIQTLTMWNLHICYKALFAGKFVWYDSQVSYAPHDVIPKCRQLIRAVQVPNWFWWHREDDVVKLQLSPGRRSCAQQRPLGCCCHTWKEQKDVCSSLSFNNYMYTIISNFCLRYLFKHF